MDTRRVVLYGRSIILGTVSASLLRYPQLEIISLSPPLPGVDELGRLHPDVILFDAHQARPDAAFTLLRDCPNLLLIGLDPEGDELLFWRSGQSSVGTTDDFVSIITEERSDAVGPRSSDPR